MPEASGSADLLDRLYPVMPGELRYPIHPSLPPWSDLPALGRSLLAGLGAPAAELRGRLGADAALLTDSGRSALVLALLALGVKPGDEVLLASFNCPAVIDAVLSAGGVPVLLDLDEDLSLSRQGLREALSRRTRAVVLTHAFGVPGEEEAARLARESGLRVVDDAAQSVLRTRPGAPLGGCGDALVLSFGDTKPLAAGGGGALLLYGVPLPAPPGREGWREGLAAGRGAWRRWRAERLLGSGGRSLRSLARRLDWLPALRADKVADFPAAGERIEPRSASRVRSCLLRGRLHRLDELRERARRNRDVLRQRLVDLRGARLLDDPERESAGADATLLFDRPGDRYRCSERLAAHGIQTCWNHYPLHLVPRYARYGRPAPRTEDLWRRVLSIPGKPPLSVAEVARVADRVAEALACLA